MRHLSLCFVFALLAASLHAEEAAPTRTLDAALLTRLLEQRLQIAVGDRGRVVVREISGDTSWTVPAGVDAFEAELPATVLGMRWVTAQVRLVAAGQVVSSRAVRCRWSCLVPAWRATRDLPAGSPLRTEDFAPMEADALEAGAGLFSAVAFPDSSQAARAIVSGRLLTVRDVQARALVRRGDAVDVVYAMGAGSCSIRMQGQALEDGVRGAVIPILNPVSKRRLQARVTDEGTAVYVQ